jgi:glycosyltransferase involved in cell wall biosynthesis
MINQPLVSVIIPCYNVSNFVERAIRSILDQTYANLEVLIVDDASTDNTLDVIKRIKDERISIIEMKQNTQKIGAVNSTLQIAKGEFIAFQDADDWSESQRIEEQLNVFIHNPQLDICFTKYRNVGKRVTVPSNVAHTNEELRDEFLRFGAKVLTHLDPTCCPSMMLKREVINKIGGYHPYFKGRVAEDIHWIYRILKKYEGNTINKVLYNYRIREGSLTQDQLAGKNVKAAYTWKLLSKIILEDLVHGKDILSSGSLFDLQKNELEACEEALAESLKTQKIIKDTYESSSSFKLGKFLLSPLHFLKQIIYLHFILNITLLLKF